MKKKYRPFKEARKFVRTLGLKTQKEWFSFCKSRKPDDIPTTPYNIYKNKGWKSLGDWLGTGRIADQNKIFRDFVKARKFVRALKLKNQPDWSKYCKSGKKPADIPTAPERVYKNKGWKDLGDWLGTKNIANRYAVFRNFKDARKFTRSLKLKSGVEWKKYCKSDKKPDDIPKSPDQAYKNKGWKSWADWLGNQSIQPQQRKFRTFKEARKFARTLKLKNTNEWKKYCKAGRKPVDIPSAPERIYKKQFQTYGDWLGTGTIAPKNIQYRTFEKARRFVRKLEIKNQKGWENYCKSGKKPKDIPATPERHYKKEWKGLGDWLGTGFIAYSNRKYPPWSEAKKRYQKLGKKYGLKGITDWRKFSKSHRKMLDELNLPTNPWNTYSKQKFGR